MKLQFIDSIRGIAILMVILVHTATYINNLDMLTDAMAKYCQMGVQLFFVASAYTLCLSTKIREGELRPLFNYAVRRYMRIAPLYYFGILMYFILAFLSYKCSNDETWLKNYSSINVFANIFFIHGFFPPANNVIVPGGWSIGTEMAFYVLFPFIFDIAKKQIKILRDVFLFVLFGLMLSQVFVIISLYFGQKIGANLFLYYNIINQLPCFFVGIGYYFYLKMGTQQYKCKYDILAFLFLTFTALFLWKMKINYLFSIIPFFSSLSFVFLMELFRKNVRLNKNVLMHIGKYSYSMYLFHFVFIWSLKYIPLPIKDYGVFSLIVLYPAVVGMTFLVGKVSFRVIEKPFINLGKRIIDKSKM